MADCSGLRERVKEEPGAKDESEGLQKQEEETPEDSGPAYVLLSKSTL